MHKTSFMKAEAFCKTYIAKHKNADGSPVRILDVGSKVYGDHKSYGDALSGENVEYVGLDLEAGDNVDLVPKNMFLWNEIEDETFDFCVSGQTFEHNPFFWITFAEMARILKPGGMLFVIAPGRGAVHRYPVDCWRYYPDAWQSLCTYTGLDLVESLFEDYQFNRVQEGCEWCDSSVAARKPCFVNRDQSQAFYAQLSRITSTLPADFSPVLKVNNKPLVALENYSKAIESSFWISIKKRLKRRRMMKRIFHSL